MSRMVNFYNNAVYYNLHTYTQGSYDPESQAKLESAAFRLELKYPPVEPSRSFEEAFDTLIVTNETFVGFCHDTPEGSGG